MKGLDNNEEAKNLLENLKGSTENRMRSLYNLGYWQGFNDGQREAVQMLERTLMDMTMADRKVENSSEIPNNCEDEPQICDTCKYGEDKHRYAHICNECGVGINNYEPKDEPQTDWKDQMWTEAIEDEPQAMYYPQVDGITPSVIGKTENSSEIPNNSKGRSSE